MAPTMPHPSEATLLLALDRELDAQELANVLEHVGTCDICRANWQRLAVLSADVEHYCHAWPPLGVEAPAASKLARSLTPRATWWATAAALLLAAAGTAAWLLIARASPPPTATATVRSDATADAHAHDIALSAPMTAPAVPPPTSPVTRAERVPKASRVVRAAESAVRRPTYYWSLPYSNRALPLDEGTVEMTVNLSREQLRLAGIPVSESRTDARVRAKVLLGADGLPRAISFDTQD